MQDRLFYILNEILIEFYVDVFVYMPMARQKHRLSILNKFENVIK